MKSQWKQDWAPSAIGILVKASSDQTSLFKPFLEVGTSEAPKLADPEGRYLTRAGNSLKRLRVNEEDCGCARAIEERLKLERFCSNRMGGVVLKVAGDTDWRALVHRHHLSVPTVPEDANHVQYFSFITR